MTKKQTCIIVAMCLLMALFIPAVSAEACSFCEFINISNITRGVTDHSLLTNLSADDHHQYLRIDGTRSMNGSLNLGSNQIISLVTGASGDSATNKTYVDAANSSMKSYVDSVALTDTAPGSNGEVLYNHGGAEGANASFVFNTATGTVTANFFVGNGSGLTGVYAPGTTILINSTVTGLPGTPANVTNIGNETAALLDFTIPQGETGATGGTGGQILYFRQANSTSPPAYRGLVPVPAGATEVDQMVSITKNSGEVLYGSFITDIGYPAVTEIPPGLWRFRTYHYVDEEHESTRVIFKVFNRTPSGAETPLFTAVSDNIEAETPTEILTTFVPGSPFRLALNDRVVVKVYMNTTETHESVKAHFVYEGSTHTSHIQTILETAPATSLSFDVIAGEDLKKGQVVYISGSLGGTPVVSLADNSNPAKSHVFGLIAEDTLSGENGITRRAGIITAVDSTSTNLNPLGQTWTAGDSLFALNGGGLTDVRPTTGRIVKVAISLAGSSENDIFLVYPVDIPDLITAPTGEDIIIRLGDSAGANKTSFRDYSNTEVAYVNSQGYASFNGSTMQSKNISDVHDPVAAQDAATKNYVDANRGYSINVMATESSLEDGQVTYFGILPAPPSATEGRSKIYFRRAGTINIAEIYSYSETAGSGESWGMMVRLNGVTDYPVGPNQTVAGPERIWSNTSINIPVVPGDYIQIKSVQPNWDENPENTTFGGYIYIE